jgi:hypothetical protein
MSLNQLGGALKYVLPASMDAVPQAFRSNRDPKPVASQLQTVNVPALTGSATASGNSVVQIPCSSSSGYGSNFYLRFNVLLTGAGTADTDWFFKGGVGACSSLINRLSTYVNSTQIDNLQNCDEVYDTVLAHGTSKSFIDQDAKVLMGAGVKFSETKEKAGVDRCFVVPLLGLLGSQQAFPLFAVQGTLQVSIDWNSAVRAIYSAGDAWGISGFSISNVQLCYDKVMVEQAYVNQVRAEMAQGQNFVYSYTNYGTTTLVSAGTSNPTLNYGLNVSSLRAVVANQITTADLSDIKLQGLSINNGMTQFQSSLDGRLISSLQLDSVVAPAVVFSEMNKCFSKLFDSSVSDLSDRATYLTNYYAVGNSCARTTEALAFAGSPCSVLSIQTSLGNTAATLFFILISDMQLVISSEGGIVIAR